MDTRPFHVLHYAGYQDVLAVADRVHLDLFAHHVLVYEYRMVLGYPVDYPDKLAYLLIVKGYPHALAAQHIGGAHENRVAELVRGLYGLLFGKDGVTRGPPYPRFGEHLVEELPVLGLVHVFSGGSENWNSHLHKGLGQLYGGLASKLHYGPVRLFDIYDIFDILRGKGLKVELVSDIEVRRHSLRVIVYYYGLVARRGKGPGRVYRAVVELDSLSYPYRAGAQYEYLFLFVANPELSRLVLALIGRIKVGSRSLELGRTGVHHLKGSGNALFLSHGLYLLYGHAVEPRDDLVGKFQPLGLPQKLRGDELAP